jgi:hypothetical protein
VARGWESKSVESQQADKAERSAAGPALSAEDRARLAERRSLELALAQTQAELGAACRPAHREMLHQRLAAIREALQRLA